jgi:hypothetical protein
MLIILNKYHNLLNIEIENTKQDISNLNLIKTQIINKNNNYCKIELGFLKIKENGIINYANAYAGRLFVDY